MKALSTAAGKNLFMHKYIWAILPTFCDTKQHLKLCLLVTEYLTATCCVTAADQCDVTCIVSLSNI